MKALIVCSSVAHGNTRKVADRLAAILDADVVEPEDVDPASLTDYDLVGFGSGISSMAMHPRLRRLIKRTPAVDGIRAFTFFTSGSPEVPVVGFSRPVQHQLEAKGFDVIGNFSCRGLDTEGPWQVVGGVHEGRPNERDLHRADQFATELREKIESRVATAA